MVNGLQFFKYTLLLLQQHRITFLNSDFHWVIFFYFLTFKLRVLLVFDIYTFLTFIFFPLENVSFFFVVKLRRYGTKSGEITFVEVHCVEYVVAVWLNQLCPCFPQWLHDVINEPHLIGQVSLMFQMFFQPMYRLQSSRLIIYH